AAHVNAIAPPHAPHRAAEIAETVNRYHSRFFKRRREECRGQVCAMVLHEMQPRMAEPHRLHLLRKACHGGAIPITMERMPESRRMTRNVCNLVGQIRVGIAPDGYVFDLA